MMTLIATVAEAVAAYAAIAAGYREQLALLAASEPDLDRVLAIADDIDRRCATIPPLTTLVSSDRAGLEHLRAALMTVDGLHRQAVDALAAARRHLVASAASDHRGDDVLRAYSGDEAAGSGSTARFIDRTL